jgi:hypothetical protein
MLRFPTLAVARRARPLTLALTAAMFTACGSDRGAGPDDGLFGGSGGTLRFTLQGVSVPPLPITGCLSSSGLFALTGEQGRTVVDLNALEGPALRDGRPIEETTSVSYRTAAPESRLEHDEFWITTRVTNFSRNGSQVTASGFMRGTRWSEGSPGELGTPTEVDGGAERPFSLTATCGR